MGCQSSQFLNGVLVYKLSVSLVICDPRNTEKNVSLRTCNPGNLEYLRLPLSRTKVEVRDSRTGYFIPVRYGLGVWPDEKIVGAPSPSPSSASSGKCPNIRKSIFFPKWTCLKFPEMLICQK